MPTSAADARDYERYLDGLGLLGHGFTFGEIVRGGPRHVMPPRQMWAAMAPTLALANELRARMVAAGARGLRVAAAYRPSGGESDSRHKYNAALDLDLLPGDALRDETFADGSMPRRLTYALAREAAKLWREREDLEVGLGTYAPDGALYTTRVHVDTGWRHRCWQGIGSNAAGKYLWARRPAALVLAPPVR